MFQLFEVADEAKKFIGQCDEVKFFRWCGDAVTLIANKADLEGWKLNLDICTAGCKTCEHAPNKDCGRRECGNRCVTLPREVETVLAVNIDGQPTLGFSQLFNFHLNGPGDCKRSCQWSWQDLGQWYCTYRDLITPSHLVVYLQTPDDNGKSFVVHGYDANGQKLRRQVNGVWLDGINIPTIYGIALPDADQPLIARITAVVKDEMAGTSRLSTIDDSGLTGVTLGIYEPDETLPQFRRIQLNRCASWVRIACRKNNPIFHSRFDRVALKSRKAFLLAIQSCKAYAEQDLALAHGFEADAARLEIEAQLIAEAPLYAPIQVIDRSNVREKGDYDIR